jgi:hypothetical protein
MAEEAARLSSLDAARERARCRTAAQKRLNKICAGLPAGRRALVEAVATEARGWIGGGLGTATERVDLWFRIVNAIETAGDERIAEATARLFLQVFRMAPLQAFTTWNEPLRELPQGIRRQMYGLLALGQRGEAWVRRVEDWRFEAGNPRPALAQLARHLLVRWEMPGFMDSVWLNDGWVWREFHDWYVHIGAGGSPRDPAAPVELSKQQIVFFSEIPATWSLPEHVWRVRAYIEARGAGASPELAVLVGSSLLGDSRMSAQNGERGAFWQSVLRYLVRHPEFPQRQIDPLVNFLEAQKFGAHAPMPGMSMKGRSPGMLLREMVVWQEHTHRGMSYSALFKPSGRNGLKLDASDGKGGWMIGELLSSRELLEEGMAMRHCVANYIPTCATGRTSMWSMRRMNSSGRYMRKLTVEVDVSGQIAQARGLGNRWPTLDELDVLQTWALAEGLTVARTVDPRPRQRRRAG